jgi:hypothetical protein
MPPGMPPQGVPPQGVPPQGVPPQPAMLPQGGLPPQIMAMFQARQGPPPRSFKRGGYVSSEPAGMTEQYNTEPGVKLVEPQRFAAGGGAWTRKEGQNPEGGLNAKGRASLKAQGQDIKPPVSAKMAAKSPKAAARRKSFCARMSGMPGPMKDEQGRPTRKALSLRKWDC